MSNHNDTSTRNGYKWIKSSHSGESYLCPIGALNDENNATDEELNNACVNESMNPQNN